MALTRIRIYFQNDPKRLPVCTLPIHSLLHLADCIKGWGPLWCYWSFPMERFCGHLKPGVSSKRHPYVSLDRYLTDWATLWHIGNVYGIQDKLKFAPHKSIQQGTRFEGCQYNHRSDTIYANIVDRWDLCAYIPMQAFTVSLCGRG